MICKSAKPGRGSPGNIGVWCNGSTTGFGSVCSSSNLDTPTKALIFSSCFILKDTKTNLLKSTISRAKINHTMIF